MKRRCIMPTFGYLPYQGWVFLFILLIIKHFPTFSFWGNYLLPIHNFTYIKANRTQSVKLRHPNWHILIHPSHDIFHLIMYHLNFIEVPTNCFIVIYSVSQAAEFVQEASNYLPLPICFLHKRESTP